MLYPLEYGDHSDCLLAGDPTTIPHGPIVNSNLGPLMEGFPKSPKLEAHVKLEGFLWGRPHDVCSECKGFLRKYTIIDNTRRSIHAGHAPGGA